MMLAKPEFPAGGNTFWQNEPNLLFSDCKRLCTEAAWQKCL